MNTNPVSTLASIADVCADIDATVAFHVRSLDGTLEVGYAADAPSVTASTYKIAVMLEVAAQASEGQLDLSDRVKIPRDRRTVGTTGISAMTDDVEVSIRDLALLMMQISDNTATDVLQDMVGTENIMTRLRSLGLSSTTITTDCDGIIALALQELSSHDHSTLVSVSSGNPYGLPEDEFFAAVAAGESLNARGGNTTTPREMTELLSLIWANKAADTEACAEVRRVMGLQFAPHRLSSAYGDDVKISGKTGSLHAGVRNEIGVVDFGGSDIYAVAVFLRNQNYTMRNGRADAAIGKIAALAIESLRQDRREPAAT